MYRTVNTFLYVLTEINKKEIEKPEQLCKDIIMIRLIQLTAIEADSDSTVMLSYSLYGQKTVSI